MNSPTLTLPIVIGKRYVRRDGMTVTAMDQHQKYGLAQYYAYVGGHAAASNVDAEHVWRDTGRVNAGNPGESHPHDLVTDAEVSASPATPHPQGDVLHAIADGRGVQAHVNDEWRDVAAREALHMVAVGSIMRVKPASIRIFGVEIDAPLTTLPAEGEVWAASPWSDGYAMLGNAGAAPGYARDNLLRALERRMLYATREAAGVHGKAMAAMLGMVTGPEA
jgi:hypothetical protein